MGEVIDTTLFELSRDYFKTYLPKQRNCSPHTFRSYRVTMNAFFDFAKEQRRVNLSAVTFEMLDSKMLDKFLDSLETAGCSIATRNQRHNCIRAFFSYAAEVDPTTVIFKKNIFEVPIKNLSKPNTLKYMNEKAIAALLEQPSPLTKKGLRDRFILSLLYDSAARCQELIDLRLCDSRLGKTPTITIRHGKGDKARDVPIMKQTVDHFQHYKQVFHPGEDVYSDCPLFYTLRYGEKQSLDNSTVRKLVISYGEAARKRCADVPKHVTTHTLRHSRAMHLYQHGMDLVLILQWLSHARLETSLIYAYADTEHKRKAIGIATPKNSPLRKRLNPNQYAVTDDERLKKLYGLKD